MNTVETITPETTLDSLSGYEKFLKQCAKLNDSTSQRETRLANKFNALSETDQQIWLKAAGCSLMTRSLCVGGERLTRWNQLRRAERNRMMTAYSCIRVIARGDV